MNKGRFRNGKSDSRFLCLIKNPALPRLIKVTPAVYPHLNDFTGNLTFHYKSRPTQLSISKHSCGFPEFTNLDLKQIGPGFSELSWDK